MNFPFVAFYITWLSYSLLTFQGLHLNSIGKFYLLMESGYHNFHLVQPRTFENCIIGRICVHHYHCHVHCLYPCGDWHPISSHYITRVATRPDQIQRYLLYYFSSYFICFSMDKKCISNELHYRSISSLWSIWLSWILQREHHYGGSVNFQLHVWWSPYMVCP